MAPENNIHYSQKSSDSLFSDIKFSDINFRTKNSGFRTISDKISDKTASNTYISDKYHINHIPCIIHHHHPPTLTTPLREYEQGNTSDRYMKVI